MPTYFQQGGKPFMFAGLWEHWERDGKTIESCSLLTTDANDVVKAVHNRMPVVLNPEDYAAWLDTPPAKAASLVPILQPSPAKGWSERAVSTLVNSPKNDVPACIVPLDPKE
jgi:putative SOS response-associated peptidase YedK